MELTLQSYINTDDKYMSSVENEFTDLDNSIELLSNNSDEDINSIQDFPILENAFKKVKTYTELLPDSYIENIVSKTFRPTDIKLASIGSYLYGCDQICYGDSTKECSPLCAMNLGSNRSCNFQIWVWNNYEEKYEQVGSVDKNSINKDNALVYVNDDFEKFRYLDIELFRKRGIENIKVLKTKNSKHETFIKLQPIDEYQTINDKPITKGSNNSNSIDSNTSSDNNNDDWTRIMLILVVIVFVVIVFMIYKNKNKRYY